MTVPTVAIMRKRKGSVRAGAKTASDAIQRRATVDNGRTPKAEAKDRIERVMNALAEKRWNRRRKLLPNLKLTYPSDDEVRHIAKLAGLNDESFGQDIHSIILDAHLAHARFRTLSTPQVKKALKRVASQAHRLRTILCKHDVKKGSRGSEDYAGWLIESELSAFQQFEVGGMVLLPEYIDLLDALSSAAQRAAQKPMHPPKGAGGNPAFDLFIQALVMAVRMRGGGSWTNYKSRDQAWTGNLLKALKILRKYLPQELFPPGDLGRSVEHIRKRLKDKLPKPILIKME
jgi:hypothetical protein